MNGSVTGINYQLKVGSTAVGSTVAGTGSALDFGTSAYAAGTYTVVATNASTSCVSTMTNSPVVTVNSLPSTSNVTAGGSATAASYCSGGSGVGITLNGSVSGVNYQLKAGSTSVGSAVAGTGAALDFGTSAYAGGTYTVVATNTTTSCTATMTNSPVITVIPNVAISVQPSNHAAVGSGAGTADFTVTAAGTSLSYQWFESTNGGVSFSGTPLTNTGVYSTTSTSTLTITNATTLMNGYQYKCSVSGTCGSPQSTDGTATLTVTSNSITITSVSTTTMCAGTNTTVGFDYSTAVSFPNGVSTFTAQLSDATGGWSSPTNLATTVTSDGSGSGSITATIPGTLVSGTGYKIRVVSA